jgi:(R)-citramalate synthase
MVRKIIEIMDSTLRDGEQTSGVSFNPAEKLNIARLLLDELHVDRIEVASARVSAGEMEGVKKITGWAKQKGKLGKIEVLGFVDGQKSVDWVKESGATVINLLCKGSLKHCQGQLGKTPEEHLSDVASVFAYARKSGISVNVYLEDWSNGMIDSHDYVLYLIRELIKLKPKRIMLADTLGILNPAQTYNFCKEIAETFPETHFDFHGHNDYDLGVANAYNAVLAGVNGLHTTINGLGERAGNVPLSSVIGILNDHLKIENNVNETSLTKVSRMVETFSGIRIPANKPLIGENVFTQTCGVHADGDSKDNLYCNRLEPERFGRVRKYALGKTSGKANIRKNLEELGLSLDPEEMQKVTERVIALGDKKENVTTEDLPYIISDVIGNGLSHHPIEIKNYSLSLATGLRPVANIAVEIYGKMYEESAIGDGQYDAFMKALWKLYAAMEKEQPVLIDYQVTIPPGGKTDALVETVITWRYKTREFKTKGLEADQTESAIKATQKMLNIIENIK